MSVSDWLSLALAVAALIVSVAAYRANQRVALANERMAASNEQTTKSNEQLVKANERMAKANDEANALSNELLEANRQLLAANERMAKSAEVSAQAAREAADSAITAYRESKMAVLEPVTRGKNILRPRKSEGVAGLTFWLRNTGQATAYELSVLAMLTVNKQGIQPVTIGPVYMDNIKPGQEQPCEISVSQFEFGDADQRDIEFIVTFTDGIGKREARFKVRVFNYWDQQWSTMRLEEHRTKLS